MRVQARSSSSALKSREKRGKAILQLDHDMIVFREGESYVAYCPELDLSSCGREVDEARANLRSAARLFLEELEKMGTRDEVLQAAGYRTKRIHEMSS